jgi:hypothetical protein
MSNRTDSEPTPRARSRTLAAGGGSAALRSATAVGIALWVIVGAGLLYGVWETVGKISALFS